MEFKGPYLQAMRERAPKLFNQLRRSGGLDAHLKQKSEEAHRLFDEITSSETKPLSDQAYSRAERQVLETLIEFPPEENPPVNADPLGDGAHAPN